MKAVQVVALLAVAVAIAVISGCSSNDEKTTGPQNTQVADTVWVNSVSAAANDQVKVDITIHNSTAIASVEVPLRLSGNDFAIDSGS